jgi:uncharacterized protein with ATP-grasp and redox domains
MIIKRSTEDENKRLDAMTKIFQMLGESFNPKIVPSYLGAERDRIIKRVTGCTDAYAEIKRRSNEKALELFPMMEEMVEAEKPNNRFRVACKIACLGNVIEYDVPGHSSDIDEALQKLGEEFFIDNTEEFLNIVSSGSEILYLTDNAGEIAFDRLVVRELKTRGCKVSVAVKGGPTLNDALMEDAEAVGMTLEADDVITTGTDAIGIRLEESSEKFVHRFQNADAIISKGMANWETLTEIPAPAPILYLFRTKCEPVATSVEAPLNRCIAKLVPQGWKLLS